MILLLCRSMSMGTPKIGETFDIYKIESVIGKGAMGQVYLATDTKLSRKVAIKILAYEKTIPNPTMKIRFENEAKILASLSHANIINVYDFGHSESFSYLVMEYFEGKNLSYVIDRRTLGLKDSVKVIKYVLRGIEEAHENGILHRDIKPANILINRKAKIKIVDFGISKNLMQDDKNLTQSDHFIGTINYLAPEILVGQPPSTCSDLYSVGIVFYELLVGANPYNSLNKFETMERIRTKDLEFPPEHLKLIPLSVRKIVAKLTCRDRSIRYQSVGEVLDDISNIKYADVPEFMNVTLQPALEVVNKKKYRDYLSDKGYLASEIASIMKMAIQIEQVQQTQRAADPEATVITGSQGRMDKFFLSDKSFRKALKEFEKSSVQFKRLKLEEVPKKERVEEQILPSPSEPTIQDSVPYPLETPNIFQKLFFGCLILLGIVYFGPKIAGSEQEFLEYVENFFETETPELQKPEPKKIVNKRSKTKDKTRQVSSIPKSKLRSPKKKLLYKFQEQKIDNKSGRTIFNSEYSLKVTNITSKEFKAEMRLQGGQVLQVTRSKNVVVPTLNVKRGKNSLKQVQVSGDYRYFYPLEIGNKTQMTFTTFNKDNGFVENQRNCEVKGHKILKQINKKLDVIEISCITLQDKNKTQSTFLYSPELQIAISEEHITSGETINKTHIRKLIGVD